MVRSSPLYPCQEHFSKPLLSQTLSTGAEEAMMPPGLPVMPLYQSTLSDG